MTQDCEARLAAIAGSLLERINRRLSGCTSDKDRVAIATDIEGALRLFQKELLHAPLMVLHECDRDRSYTLLDALRKLFRLELEYHDTGGPHEG